MRKFFLIAILCAFFLGINPTAEAQKLAYVDTEYVLQRMPDYSKAQTQLDQTVESWRREIEQRFKEIDRLYKQFQAEQVLLSDKERVEREEAIVAKEKDARALQRKRFGDNGDLFLKRQELVKPIQQQVYQALEKTAKKKGIDIVLDKSSGVSILYGNPDFDLTNDLMKELGLSDN